MEEDKRYQVKLDCGAVEIFDTSNWYYENDIDFVIPTLKDIAIVMYAMAPCGAQHSLSLALAEKFGLDPYEVEDALEEIFKEWRNMTDEEAYNKFLHQKNLNIDENGNTVRNNK